MSLAERAARSAWVGGQPGLADAVAEWEDDLASFRESLPERAAQLAKPGPIHPLRAARHYGAVTAAQLGWLVRRVPADVADRLRPVRDPAAWVQDSVAYLVRDQLALLGPTAAEVARIIDESEGIAPTVLVDELRRRPIVVDPMPTAEVARLAALALGAGITIGGLVTATPLSQLHRVELADGTDALLRVRRPGAARAARQDMRIAATLLAPLEWTVAAVRDAHPLGLVELAARQLLEESDLRNEALNAVALGLAIEELEVEGIICFRPIPGLVSRQAAAYEDIPGAVPLLAGLGRLDGPAAATAIARLTLEAALASGTFHADLRPEQFAVLPDGRLAVVGCGVVGRFDRATRRVAIESLVALMSGDAGAQVAAMEFADAVGENTDVKALIADLESAEALQPMTVLAGGEAGVLNALQTAISILLRHGVRPPLELVLFVRNLLSVRALLRVVNPHGSLMDALTPLVMRLPQLRAELA